jgi:hypothetical protein
MKGQQLESTPSMKMNVFWKPYIYIEKKYIIVSRIIDIWWVFKNWNYLGFNSNSSLQGCFNSNSLKIIANPRIQSWYWNWNKTSKCPHLSL